MKVSIKLSEHLLNQAKAQARISRRSTSCQIEYWVMLGRMAEQNPDLSFEMISGLLQARIELKLNNISDYRFG